MASPTYEIFLAFQAAQPAAAAGGTASDGAAALAILARRAPKVNLPGVPALCADLHVLGHWC